MANGHGGYRRPSKPAPVSPPGKYARRTDGRPGQVLSAAPDQDYGAIKQQLDQQRVAPLGAAAPMPAPAAAAPQGNAGALSGQTPSPYTGGAFNAPSARPNEPVTAGVPMGAGPGPEALSFPTFNQAARPDGSMTNLLRQLSVRDTSGTISKLLNSAIAYGA